MSSDAAQQNRRDDLSAAYGDLLLHAENPVGRVRNRTVRWALLVALALLLASVVLLHVFRVSGPGSGPPAWWIYVLLLTAWLLLLWGVGEFLGLLSAWRRVGWSVDVYQQGVVESRFGTVRQAMQFSGGVLGLHRALFTSPHPQHGSGRLTAPWRGELAQAASTIRTAARPVLVRETLAQLRAGHAVSFPGKRNGKPGITLTPNMLRLPDGREYEYTSMQMQYSTSNGDGSGYTVTDDPARADGFHFLTDDEDKGFRTTGGHDVPGLHRTSPNLAVVREVLHILIDPDGQGKHHGTFSRPDQEQQ